VLAAAAAYPAAAVDRHADQVAALGALGVGVFLLGTAVRFSEAIPVGLALVGAEYAGFVALREDSGVHPSAPLVAGALVLAAEVAYSAVEPPLAAASLALRALRAARILALAVGSAGVAALVLYVSVADVQTGLALELTGIVAATSVLALLAWLARCA
jgi:hypothetical protein